MAWAENAKAFMQGTQLLDIRDRDSPWKPSCPGILTHTPRHREEAPVLSLGLGEVRSQVQVNTKDQFLTGRVV